MLIPLVLALDLSRIAAESGGTVGVAAVHFETGRRAGLNNTQPFPMASTYKLPIAVAFLSRNPDLSAKVPLHASDIRAFRSPVADRAPKGGIDIVVGELFDQMLLESDNTAADYIHRLAGGPAAVTAHMRKLGIDGMRIDRSEGQLAFDYAGVEDPPPQAQWTLDLIHHLLAGVPRARQRAAAERFLTDPRDTTTPDAMLQLLVYVEKQGNARLLDRMTRMVPGAARMKGLLPQGTPVAHRTGTGGDFEGVSSATNDVGIITTPAGHIALAVFVKASRSDLATRERTIAKIARALCDEWN